MNVIKQRNAELKVARVKAKRARRINRMHRQNAEFAQAQANSASAMYCTEKMLNRIAKQLVSTKCIPTTPDDGCKEFEISLSTNQDIIRQVAGIYVDKGIGDSFPEWVMRLAHYMTHKLIQEIAKEMRGMEFHITDVEPIIIRNGGPIEPPKSPISRTVDFYDAALGMQYEMATKQSAKYFKVKPRTDPVGPGPCFKAPPFNPKG